jgi:hypothetical protein
MPENFCVMGASVRYMPATSAASPKSHAIKRLSQHNESGETKRRFLCVTRRWFGIGDMCVESVSSQECLRSR